ncbi:hypothetical protein EVG20_g8722 [Dentipellis fragilis]|uniref:Uncharacterized protein n=1 Tax=Dentipellis fragilis TaxID=205917 RepID=A0A4Y9Y4X3_9AGAM|nr:hypothetical protein EVG20_g8722 [Dentipellis fragilis]
MRPQPLHQFRPSAAPATPPPSCECAIVIGIALHGPGCRCVLRRRLEAKAADVLSSLEAGLFRDLEPRGTPENDLAIDAESGDMGQSQTA